MVKSRSGTGPLVRIVLSAACCSRMKASLRDGGPARSATLSVLGSWGQHKQAHLTGSLGLKRQSLKVWQP